MDKALLNSLTEAETRLVAETEREALTELDEDALLQLHTRVRRARTKYVGMYRRQASARVQEHGGRGVAHAKSQRNRDKAELFELTLARVSRRVEVVAKQAAAELRAERLAAARSTGADPRTTEDRPASGVGSAASATAPTKPRSRAVKTTGGLKKDASTRAKGARRQAKKDSR